MKLELIYHPPHTDSKQIPWLFIHGAFAGAWCWDEYFLPYFAQQDYSAYAISLRGHGQSSGILCDASLADYVADVAQVTQQFSSPPILVGHSMGGMVVQKYLEAHHPATAAILMASVPPSGLWASSCYLAMTHPIWFWQLNLMQYVSLSLATPNIMEKVLFSNPLPEEKAQKYFALMQGESQRAIWDLLGLDLPKRSFRPSLPMLVLGAEQDVFFPPALVRRTATRYATTSHIFPDMAHAMMLETNWQTVADYLLTWSHSL